MSALTVKNLTVSFSSREGRSVAADDISFELNEGELLGIVGESGSGKSVTCYSILGLIPCPPGQVESGSAIFQEQDLLKLDEKSLRRVRGKKISMIFQDPMTSLNPYMTIGNQIIESIRIHEKLSKPDARKRAIAALEEVGIRDAHERIDSYPHEYSGGMRQRVMIAMALATEPEILIADEPTTALDVTIQAQILELLANIQGKRKLSIIFITHDLAVIQSIAQHILVMEKGKIVERGSAKNIFGNPQHAYTKKLISAIPTTAKQIDNASNDDTLLEIRGLSTSFETLQGPPWNRRKRELKAVDDVSLTLKQGEIVGLVGESGSGKSTLGRSVMRLVDSKSGEILLNETNILSLDRDQLKAERKNFQMIFQDPYASLNPRMTVFDILAEPLLLHRQVSKKDLDQAINTLMDEVGLDRRFIRKYPHEFSGGQRQRIAIARAVALKPKLIIADEPVSALDVTIQAQVLDLLLELARNYHITMLFISHDLSVVRYICDRVAVMQAGQLVEIEETEQLYNFPQNDYSKQLLSAIPKL
ncbi:MAG: ABC transporter ATP-binding protein [Agarilytica sp.]